MAVPLVSQKFAPGRGARTPDNRRFIPYVPVPISDTKESSRYGGGGLSVCRGVGGHTDGLDKADWYMCMHASVYGVSRFTGDAEIPAE